MLKKSFLFITLSLLTLTTFSCAQTPTSTTQPLARSIPTPIDIAHAPAPLFDDALFHGASDPFVIWNPAKALWFMYYTQRRASMPDSKGVDWVHGSAIGNATSKDGVTWEYAGVCQGDHNLPDPLNATGNGPEPGITWWAPCFLNVDGTFHMFVVLVDGIYTNWTGHRNILHFTSTDGVTWKFLNTCALSSNRVIDPTVYKIGDTWYMVYKDEAAGSNTFRSQSTDLVTWTNPVQITHDGSQEAPFVFHWKNSWWLIVDSIAHHGLRLYKSPDGVNDWTYSTTILGASDGTRPTDRGIGHHPGIVLQGGPTNDDQCLVFYFTQQGRRTLIQLAELELGPDGVPVCNRNK